MIQSWTMLNTRWYTRIFCKSSDYLRNEIEIEPERMCWRREIAQFELFDFPPLCIHMRQLQLLPLKVEWNCLLGKNWVKIALLLGKYCSPWNFKWAGGCAGPFDHTGEGRHHPLCHGSREKDPLWVGHPNIFQPFILNFCWTTNDNNSERYTRFWTCPSCLRISWSRRKTRLGIS